jgi:hypothetical protein
MTKHGLPPLVGGFTDGKVTWQRIETVDYDTLGYLLSCHLIIEHYLDNYLETRASASFGWQEAKLTFGQKISLVSKLPFPEPYDFSPAIKHLNSLRNKFSHNISATVSDKDLLPFRHCLEKCTKGECELPTDVKDLLSLFTIMVCAFFAGSITSHAELKKITKRK